jgi:hypothetical protein
MIYNISSEPSPRSSVLVPHLHSYKTEDVPFTFLSDDEKPWGGKAASHTPVEIDGRREPVTGTKRIKSEYEDDGLCPELVHTGNSDPTSRPNTPSDRPSMSPCQLPPLPSEAKFVGFQANDPRSCNNTPPKNVKLLKGSQGKIRRSSSNTPARKKAAAKVRGSSI